jgi:hypothetical protein
MSPAVSISAAFWPIKHFDMPFKKNTHSESAQTSAWLPAVPSTIRHVFRSHCTDRFSLLVRTALLLVPSLLLFLLRLIKKTMVFRSWRPSKKFRPDGTIFFEKIKNRDFEIYYCVMFLPLHE